MSVDMIVTELRATAVPIPGDEIDTDRIIPARFLKEITFEKMGEYLFCDARYDAEGNETDFPLNDARFEECGAMVVGSNFGCGSSREHAPQAVKRYGIKFLVGKSFAEIFAGNCKALGMPAVTAAPADVDALAAYINENPSTTLILNLEKMVLGYGGGKTIEISMMPERREAFLAGTWDASALLKANADKVQEVAASLPHMQIRAC